MSDPETQASSPQNRGEVLVTLRTPDGQDWPGRIVMVGSEFVGLGFPADAAPTLGEQDVATLIFQDRHTDGALTAHARLLVRAEEEREIQLQMRFEALPLGDRPRWSESAREASRDEEDPSNRREVYRVQGELLQSVEVVMRPFGRSDRSILRQLADLRMHGAQRTVQARLFDLSTMGMGILVPDDAAHRFEIGDHVDLSFTLPEEEDPCLLSGTVKHRLVVRVGVRYGIEFDQVPLPHFHRLQRDLLEFVMRQQRENLRSKTG